MQWVQYMVIINLIRELEKAYSFGKNNLRRTCLILVSLIIYILIAIIQIVEIMDGFMNNRNLPREYFKEKLETIYKPILIKKWKAEATYH